MAAHGPSAVVWGPLPTARWRLPPRSGRFFPLPAAAARAPEQHPGHLLLQAAEAGRELRPGHRQRLDDGKRPDAVLIWWDYLLASEVGAKYKNLKIVIPSDANYAAYYDQAVSKYAPHPAAARLWEEYLYSAEGQNLFLAGGTRPIEVPSLVSAGTEDKTAYAALPPAPAEGITFPSIAQQNTAENVVAQQWPSVSS